MPTIDLPTEWCKVTISLGGIESFFSLREHVRKLILMDVGSMNPNDSAETKLEAIRQRLSEKLAEGHSPAINYGLMIRGEFREIIETIGKAFDCYEGCSLTSEKATQKELLERSAVKYKVSFKSLSSMDTSQSLE